MERLVPPERVQRRINEQIVEIPLPPNTEDAEDAEDVVQRVARSHHKKLA